METVFHYGKESEKFLRAFEEKRADYSIQEITDLPVEDLKSLLFMFQQGKSHFCKTCGDNDIIQIEMPATHCQSISERRHH